MDLAETRVSSMEVSCPACAARYTADDSKLRGKTARMRCRACDTVWLVSGPSSASSVAEAASDLDNTAPRAAIQRKGAERERRDLFASRPVEEGGVKETLRPPPPSSFAPSSAVAARNENSVLFKVSDVLGAGANARVKTPEPSASPAYSVAPASGASPGSFAPPARDGRDDSGIIDLKALSSAPPRANRAPAPMLFGGVPSEPPPAFARDVAASSSFYPQQPGAPKNKLRSIGMIAAGFAVVASNPPPKAAAALPAPPPPAPPPVATTPPAPEPAPAATASESKEEKTEKKTAGKKHRGGNGKAAAASGVITNKTPPPPPAPKVKAADPCGCHGDFNCILACTAGKK